MKQIFPFNSYPIVIERKAYTEQPQRFILHASTDYQTPEDVLINFYKKSLSIIDDAINSVHTKYPKLYGI